MPIQTLSAFLHRQSLPNGTFATFADEPLSPTSVTFTLRPKGLVYAREEHIALSRDTVPKNDTVHSVLHKSQCPLGCTPAPLLSRCKQWAGCMSPCSQGMSPGIWEGMQDDKPLTAVLSCATGATPQRAGEHSISPLEAPGPLGCSPNLCPGASILSAVRF